jgi:hypothetical protein
MSGSPDVIHTGLNVETQGALVAVAQAVAPFESMLQTSDPVV